MIIFSFLYSSSNSINPSPIKLFFLAILTVSDSFARRAWFVESTTAGGSYEVFWGQLTSFEFFWDHLIDEDFVFLYHVFDVVKLNLNNIIFPLFDFVLVSDWSSKNGDIRSKLQCRSLKKASVLPVLDICSEGKVLFIQVKKSKRMKTKLNYY